MQKWFTLASGHLRVHTRIDKVKNDKITLQNRISITNLGQSRLFDVVYALRVHAGSDLRLKHITDYSG